MISRLRPKRKEKSRVIVVDEAEWEAKMAHLNDLQECTKRKLAELTQRLADVKVADEDEKFGIQ